MNEVKEISDEQYLAQHERYQLVELRPAPVEMDNAARYEWLSEYCDKFVFLRSAGLFLVVDCDGRVTQERNLADAVDMAVAKFNEGNHP